MKSEIVPDSSFLFDSSELQREAMQVVDRRLSVCSALLIAFAHIVVAVLCLTEAEFGVAIMNAVCTGFGVAFAAFAKHRAPLHWLPPLGCALVLSCCAFFLLVSPGVYAVLFYMLLPVPAFRVLGLTWGGVLVVAFSLLAAYALFLGRTANELQMLVRIKVMIAVAVASGFGWCFEFLRRRSDNSLEGLLKQLHVLYGVIPICSTCKSVRAGEGSWRRIETVMRREGQVEFSHGLCATCFEEAVEQIGD